MDIACVSEEYEVVGRRVDEECIFEDVEIVWKLSVFSVCELRGKWNNFK